MKKEVFCKLCERIFPGEKVVPFNIGELLVNLKAGETVPAGACPDCGSFVYPISPGNGEPIYIAVATQGGMISSVASMTELLLGQRVIVIDYDDASEESDMLEVKQSSGHTSRARVSEFVIEVPKIDLDDLVKQLERRQQVTDAVEELEFADTASRDDFLSFKYPERTGTDMPGMYCTAEGFLFVRGNTIRIVRNDAAALQSRISAACTAADDAFWAAVVKAFPEIKTGDFPPLALNQWDCCVKDAITTWVHGNRPPYERK
ncbi:MAG: hypothetical protein C0402_05300 [Thermodesulfovibrio sp.]|nr:hypothetical protein [Thermodesulfovibrio sp.]